ncbi:MAG: hypothetical protein KJZ47_01645, partial [Gemmatimonadales bacterium]|nr:hypothetical protein [Gemmatimonadales bacterium]
DMRVLLLAGAFVAVSTLAEAQALRTLPRVEVEHAEPFTRVAGVRELRDGRVIVLDAQDQSIHLVNLAAGTATPIGRQGDGPGEFRLPLRIFGMAGDTSVVYDMVRPYSMLVITPDGKPSGARSIEGAEGGLVTRVNVDAADGMGRLYGKANIGRTTGDSVEIVRLNSRNGRWEAVAKVCNKAVSELRPDWGCGRGMAPVSAGPVRMSGGPVPFATGDQWAVALDGRIALVAANPYRVTMISSDGTRRVGPILSVAPVRLTEEHKQAYLHKLRQPVATIASTRDGQTTTSYRTMPVQEPTEWPSRLPAFLQDAARFASDGTLWVQRTTADASAPPTYDLIGPAGTVTSRLVLPARTRLVGFGAGTIYLVRIDADDLEYLQRYRMP